MQHGKSETRREYFSGNLKGKYVRDTGVVGGILLKCTTHYRNKLLGCGLDSSGSG
jgi:hypothetical protein